MLRLCFLRFFQSDWFSRGCLVVECFLPSGLVLALQCNVCGVCVCTEAVCVYVCAISFAMQLYVGVCYVFDVGSRMRDSSFICMQCKARCFGLISCYGI